MTLPPKRTGPNSAEAARSYPQDPKKVLAAAERAIARLPRWHVESRDADTLGAVRATRLFRFKDDVALRAAPTPSGGTRLVLTSASRVGRNDLGQNPRNLAELLAVLEGELGSR
jgi:uncharacterized protein (DUF1499 family)